MKRKALERCSRRNSRDTSEVKGIEQNSNEDSMLQLPGIPLAPSNQNMNPGVTFVLEKASLVPVYVKKGPPPNYGYPDFVWLAGYSRCMLKTDEEVLIKVEPHARIPESSDKFCVQLLQKLRIKAQGRRDRLLRVVQNPLAQHLPANSVKIVQLREYVSVISDKANLVFVAGAMAHGKIDSECG